MQRGPAWSKFPKPDFLRIFIPILDLDQRPQAQNWWNTQKIEIGMTYYLDGVR